MKVLTFKKITKNDNPLQKKKKKRKNDALDSLQKTQFILTWAF